MTAAANPSLADLDLIARRLRLKVIEMSHTAGTPHLGSALSCLDILVAAYWNVVKTDANNPADELRDRFILSKGHAAMGLYATLASRGIIDRKLLSAYYENDGTLPALIASCKPGSRQLV